MTTLLYQTDAYLKEFDAVVTAVDDDAHGVFLDRTAFYPGGGGQPADTGSLAFEGTTVAVPAVKKGNLHVMDGELPAVGTEVHGVLDWDRRYRLMRTHTAMHILCGVVWRDYGA